MSRALSNQAFFKAAHFSKLLFVCATALCGLLGAPSATAQTPQLVKDLETRWKLVPCAQGITLGDHYVFAAGGSERCALHTVDRSFREPTQLSGFGTYSLKQIGANAVYLGCVDGNCTLSSVGGPANSLQQLFPKTGATGGIQPQDIRLEKVSNRLVFRVCNGTACVLWSTDGTFDGTLPLHSSTVNLGTERAAGFSTLWFMADSGQGLEWWNTDGTPTGTLRVGPVVPDSTFGANDQTLYSLSKITPQKLFRLPKGSYPQAQEQSPMVLPLGMAVFSAMPNGLVLQQTDSFGPKLFVADNFSATTPTNIATGVPLGFWIKLQRNAANTVAISCGNAGCRTWATDGTPLGSALLFNEAPTTISASSAVESGDGKLLVPIASAGAEGLYAVNGTTATKVFAGSVLPTAADKDRVHFCPAVPANSPTAGTWATDGTVVGTRKLLPTCVIDTPNQRKPIAWGTELINGPDLFAQTGERRSLVSANSRDTSFWDHASFDNARAAFYWCNSDGCRFERTDGSSTGTYAVSAGEYLPTAPSGQLVSTSAMTNVSGTVYVLKNVGDTVVLATIRDSANGVSDLKTFATVLRGRGDWDGSNRLFAKLGNKIYFAACFNGVASECGLWATDGTTAGTSLMAALPPTTEAFVADLVSFNGGFVFNWCAEWGANNCKIAFSDGTSVGTRLLDFNPSGPPVVVNNRVWFVHIDSTFRWRMMQSDGTAAGTSIVPELANYSFTYEFPIAPLRDGYIVAAGFIESPVPERTVLFYKPGVPPVRLAGFNSQFTIRPFTVSHAGRFVFAAGDWRTSTNELWTTDGSIIGTRKIDEQVTVATLNRDRVPHLLLVGNNIAYQRCLDSRDRCETRSTNASGTEVSTIVGAPFSALYGRPVPLRSLGNRMLFEGDDGKSGRELWIVDVPEAVDSDGDGIPDAAEALQGTNPLLADNDIFGNARLFAMQQARDFFGREATPGEITTMVNAIASGTTRSALIEQMLNTPEHFDLYGPILRLYQAYFLRPSDIGGLNFWVTQYKNRPASGWSFEGISEFFSLSPEFQQRYGALNNNQFVTLIYSNVLKRAPDAGGLTFWVDELDKGRRIRGNVMAGFSESPENKGKTKGEVQVATLYGVMLKKDIDPVVYAEWVQRINAGQSIRPLIDQLFVKPEYRARFLP